jgi:6-pyruvoyltetrahydropterin/6-carboxytetrahydropterin synthase
MVLDFGFLKELLTEHVHDVFDHGFIVHDGDKRMKEALGLGLGGLLQERWKVIVFPTVPTAENLAVWIWDQLKYRVRDMTDGRAQLSSIEVWETPTSCASYGDVH